MKPLFFTAVIEDHIETPGHGNNQLLQSLVCVAAPFRPARDIIEVVDAANVERDMIATFDKGEITPRV